MAFASKFFLPNNFANDRVKLDYPNICTAYIIGCLTIIRVCFSYNNVFVTIAFYNTSCIFITTATMTMVPYFLTLSRNFQNKKISCSISTMVFNGVKVKGIGFSNYYKIAFMIFCEIINKIIFTASKVLLPLYQSFVINF